MGNAMGAYLGGVRDRQSLLEHCRVDDETGCWRYAGCCIKGHPSIQIRLPDGRAIRRRGRRAAMIVTLGYEPPADQVAYPTPNCVWPDCVRPDHCQLGTLGQARTAAGQRGVYDTPAMRTHLARMQQAKRKITLEVEAAIRNSDEPTKVEAERHGISVSRVKAIRRGNVEQRQRAASVFEWRP